MPSNPIWVEEPTYYNYQNYFYTTPSPPTTTSTTTTQKPPKIRKKLKVKLKKKPKKKVEKEPVDFYYIDDEDEIETDKNPEGLVSQIVNFLAVMTGISSGSEAKQDDFVIPAEVSMGLVGLYGLYFLAVSLDLSNRRKRKKRSLFHQGSQLLFRTNNS